MISMNKEYHFGALRKGLNAVKEAWGKKKKEEGHSASPSTCEVGYLAISVNRDIPALQM